MAVTIKDVAAKAGVSPSTVSRVCNDNPSISKQTRDRVKRVMAQLGYESVSVPTSPEKDAPGMVAIVLPPAPRESYGNPFFMEAIRGISEFCNPRLIATTVITGSTEVELLETVRALSDKADGGRCARRRLQRHRGIGQSETLDRRFSAGNGRCTGTFRKRKFSVDLWTSRLFKGSDQE